jgi:hypothetical protein
MKYYLLDASAIVYAVEYLDTIRLNFFEEKQKGKAFLYIPQFCVAEVLNTFARLCFRDKKINPDQYTTWRGEFINAIHNGRIFYAYDLHRYHNLNADKVYSIEHKTPLRGNETPLSTFDILIIAMGMELKKIHHPTEVIILTRDSRLHCISNKSPDFPKAEWFE